MAEALYRKYRPQIFEDVVGQEHIERTIKNAIAQDKLSHAYLFTGPRGTGKTTTARLLAKALLCEKGPTAEPDGSCVDCQMIANGEHPDVYELDAASRTGVENVREEIIGRVQFAPTRGRYKIYIIDEVHMLSTAAFNALLKTLEEPPSHVVFILATTDPQKVPETILSRCQRFDFHRISLEAIVSRLGAICVNEGVEFETEALDLVAHRAEGGMRNALTSLEQLIAFGDGKVTLEVAERMLGSLDSSDLHEIVQAVGRRDVAACFRWTAQYVETGSDLAQFTRDFAEHMRNMYVMSLAGADVALEVGAAARRELAEELPLFGPDRLARLLGVLGDLTAELKTSTNPRLSFEIALTRMVRPESDLTLESLAARIEALESGAPVVTCAVNPAAVMQAAPVERVAAAAAAAPASVAPAAEVRPEPKAAAAAAPVAEPVRETKPAAEPVAAAAVAVAVQAAVAQPAAEPAAQPAAEPAASAASAAGASAAGAPSELKNPAALQRMWQTALAALKKEKAAYGVLFLNTKAVYDESANCLTIEFPAENAFAFKAVQKPDICDALQAAIARACGSPVPFSFAQAGSIAVAASPVAAARVVAEPVPAVARTASVQPVREVQPAQTVQAQQPAQPAQPVREPQPASADAVPYDEVPLDVYDSYVPYDELDDYCTAPVQAAPAQAARQAEPVQVEPAFAQAAPVEAASSEGSAVDLQAILTQSFGSGVVFQEVNE